MSSQKEPELPPENPQLPPEHPPIHVPDLAPVPAPELGGRRKTKRRKTKRRKSKRRHNSRRRRQTQKFRKKRGGFTLLKGRNNSYTIIFSEAEKNSIKSLYKAYASRQGHGDDTYRMVYQHIINHYINSKANYGAKTTSDETEIEDLNNAESAGVQQIKMIVTGQNPEL